LLRGLPDAVAECDDLAKPFITFVAGEEMFFDGLLFRR